MKRLGGFSLLALASAGALGFAYSAAPAAAKVRMIVPEDVYRLCEKRKFTQAELRALQQRPDYEMILRYTADQCSGVAGLLSGGATATLPAATGAGSGSAGAGAGAATRGVATAAAAGASTECQPGLGGKDSCDDVCGRSRFTTREIAELQRRVDFPAILGYALQQCPAVASVLTDTATASLPGSGTGPESDPGFGGGSGNNGGGDNGGGDNGGGDNGGGDNGGGDNGGGDNGGGGNGGGDNGGGDNGGGDNGGGDNGGGDNGGGDNGGGDNGGGDNGGGDNGGGDNGGGGTRPAEPDKNTDYDGWKDWRDQYGPGSGWTGKK